MYYCYQMSKLSQNYNSNDKGPNIMNTIPLK